MAYRSLRECVNDLDRQGMLLRIKDEVDPELEMAEIQRQIYRAGGPAIFFERVKGSPFQAVSNLFGTMERTRYIFRKTWTRTHGAILIKSDPEAALRQFWKFWHAPFTGLLSLPKATRGAPVLEFETTMDQLPQIKSWPDDGGPFITLPQVYSEEPLRPGVGRANIGMYRVQMAGNHYIQNEEVGLHYQIHRGIGVHHAQALELGKPLQVAVFIGGPPAHTVAAVMPLPEGLSEVVFAGMLAGRRFRHQKVCLPGYDAWRVAADADFCILGVIDGNATKPEGPFGDHLGYYSLQHEFPLMKVLKVYHRKDPIWHFTAVGRPPQEDSSFGAMIHELTKPMVPASLPGVKSMHAVDAAGVHPLLFAIGSERYAPFTNAGPQELLTQANAILGFNQASLAKYLLIADSADDPNLDANQAEKFLQHVLARVDWRRDLHFQTKTTIDTLDYSGSGFNQGSKLVIAARGKPLRRLAASLPEQLKYPPGFSKTAFVLPGVMVLEGAKFETYEKAFIEFSPWSSGEFEFPAEIPLVVIVDDAAFASSSLANWLWITFTRSQPSHDVYGVGSRVDYKHWLCNGSLLIDARIKPHHAPALVESPQVAAVVLGKIKNWRVSASEIT
ncbi:MAG: UbiD family decarboxylase [Proteobacteria bacterium]|nr:UbiD family decarboxylase [Pseudomonadota bacterium]